MSSAYETWQRAEGQIQIAVRRLTSTYPFHAAILGRFRPTHRPDVGTMGVAVDGNHILLYYHSEFTLSLPMDQLVGVLLHEVHHVLFGHVSADSRDYPDRWARTVAEEVTVNEFVHEPLPGDAIVLEDFPELPPRESTVERYRRLEQVTEREGISVPGDTSADNSAAGNGGKERLGSVIDDHSVWGEPAGDRDRMQETIDTVVEESLLEVGADQIPEELHESIGRHHRGLHSAAGTHRLQSSSPPRIDWRLLLRRYTGRVLQRRPSFHRPPRRLPHLVGMVPGSSRRLSQPKVMAVIDTSASITPELLETINAELAQLARSHRVTVVECDAAIRRVYRYRPLQSVEGRGGTDLRPPFATRFLRQHRPDLLIYFTDGQGPAPERPPDVPVIWCLAPEGSIDPDWGRVVHIT